MERIFKIRTKTNRNPLDQYPSERRYSASIVLGLSVTFFQLFLFSLLMGTLIIHKIGTNVLNNTKDSNETNEVIEAIQSAYRQRDKLENQMGYDYSYSINIPALTCATCYIMAAGYLLSFITGLFAWQRWYIDHNITFFFLSCSFSTVTSSTCLIVTLLGFSSMDYNSNLSIYITQEYIPLSFSLAMNIIILSTVGTIWSVLSSRLAFKGMRNTYPEDIDVSKAHSHIDVTSVRTGSKNANMFPPDIISHFPPNDKLAKYLPKKEDNTLPKAESNYEYQQRVDKFLSGEPENAEK